MSWFSLHTHSEFSSIDAMTPVEALVAKAASLGQPALGLTDHGNMSGAYQLYRSCREHGLLPFPGFEAYVVDDHTDKNAERFHLTMTARTTDGYRGLVKLSSTSHRRDHYHRKPRVDMSDMALLDERERAGIVVGTGCYFGAVSQAIVRGEFGTAKTLVEMLAALFPWTFVELQHHHTDHGDEWTDDALVAELLDLADQVGLRIIITQDCHYLDRRHRHDHTAMKALGQFSDQGDVGFPGDSYHLATRAWVASHYDPAVFDWAERSMGDLLYSHELELPFLDTYRYRVPVLVDDPLRQLKKLTEDCPEEYRARLDEELDVIEATGFSDYFLLVHDIVEFCRDQDILVIARGSANNSLVCHLLGITQVDPVRWRLTFDRFLTVDRKTPPDIDLDVEDHRRDEVVEYVRRLYGGIQIGTYNSLSLNPDGTGSVLRRWLEAKRRVLGQDQWVRAGLGKVKTVHDIPAAFSEEQDRLKAIASEHSVRSAHGAHAAGFVLDHEDQRIEEWMPTMLVASSGHTVTQMMMDDVEDAGWIKVDILGLRTLTLLHEALDLIGMPTSDLGLIPLDDPDTFKLLRKGRQDNGIFQLEGWTASKGCKELKVRNVEDVALVNALYRPAARDSGYKDLFLERRAAKQAHVHPVLEPALGWTWGVPVFQEQVLEAVRALGLDAVWVNRVLKAIKVKHGKAGYSVASTQAFEEARDELHRIAEAQGLDPDTVDEVWAGLEGFRAYGFNRGHAAAYSTLGVQSAWLKTHHPLEWHCALLRSVAGRGKSVNVRNAEEAKSAESLYMAEARQMGLTLRRADVNKSGWNWTIDADGKSLRQGLVSLKGIGEKAARHLDELRPFASIEDLVDRVDARTVSGGKQWAKEGEPNGTLGVLKRLGALSSLGVSS